MLEKTIFDIAEENVGLPRYIMKMLSINFIVASVPTGNKKKLYYNFVLKLYYNFVLKL